MVTHAVVVPDPLDDIPRVGVRLRIGPGVHAVEWLGAGPHECYSDRRASARVGRWTTPVDDWPVPYVHPQASGNRIDVRWLRFLDADGEPLLTIDELDDLQVTVARVTDEELAAAGHLEDLPATRRVLTCGSTPASAASARARAAPTPRPSTASVRARTAGRTGFGSRRYAAAFRNAAARLPRRAITMPSSCSQARSASSSVAAAAATVVGIDAGLDVRNRVPGAPKPCGRP